MSWPALAASIGLNIYGATVLYHKNAIENIESQLDKLDKDLQKDETLRNLDEKIKNAYDYDDFEFIQRVKQNHINNSAKVRTGSKEISYDEAKQHLSTLKARVQKLDPYGLIYSTKKTS